MAFTRPVNLASAHFLVDGNRFVEAIIAPSFDEDAFELLTTKPKWGKNVRLLSAGEFGAAQRDASDIEVKKVVGGFLLQGRDLKVASEDELKIATKAQPSADQMLSLRFAEKVCKHVKSNAIIFVKGTRVTGVGAGQMSRVDSTFMAARKSGDEAQGTVMASDAFFPFPDGVESAMDAGVVAILQPGGSMRDQAVIDACDARNVPMVMTGARHFRH